MVSVLFQRYFIFCLFFGSTSFNHFRIVMTYGAINIERDVALLTQNAVVGIKRWNSLLLLLDYSESINVFMLIVLTFSVLIWIQEVCLLYLSLPEVSLLAFLCSLNGCYVQQVKMQFM